MVDFLRHKDAIDLEKNIAAKVEKVLEIVADMFFSNKLSGAFEVMQYGEELAEKENYERGLALMKVRMGTFYFFANDNKNAKICFEIGIAKLEELADIQSVAESLPFYSMLDWSLGNYAEALQRSTRSVSLFADAPNKKRFPLALFTLATQHFDLKDYERAEHFYIRSLEVNENIDIETARFKARSYIGLANIAMVKNKREEAENYLMQASHLQENNSDNFGKARTLNDLAKLHREAGNLNTAFEYYRQTIELRENFLDKNPLITSYLDLGELFLDFNHFQEAHLYFTKAIQIAEEKSVRSKIWRSHQLFSKLYKAQNDFEKALFHYEKYVEVKESVLGDEASLKVKNLQSKFESEKAEKEAEIYRLKNVELKTAYEVIEEQNKNIIDSINYAKRIQGAVLPEEKVLRNFLTDFFIYWQPRDIVSGDFYWFAGKEAFDNDIFGDFNTESGTVIAVADCTGHGVPGALMSVMGANILEEIVMRRHITAPNIILYELNRAVRAFLKQEENNIRDGMDIAVIRINKEKTRLDFAGANNGLLIIHENEIGEKIATHIEADRRSVGGLQRNSDNVFTLKSLAVAEYINPIFYLYTDGYADQFGGAEKRKFMRKNLFEILKNMSNLAFDLQKKLLHNNIQDWMVAGNEKQIDDMLIMGLKL
jgi:tetratricopeptide (TPR) repeat protein